MENQCHSRTVSDRLLSVPKSDLKVGVHVLGVFRENNWFYSLLIVFPVSSS